MEDQATATKEDASKEPELKVKKKKKGKKIEKNESGEGEEKERSVGEGDVTASEKGGKEEVDVEKEEAVKKKKATTAQLVKKRTLLVIGGKASINWADVFKGATLHAGLVNVEVEMASWEGDPPLQLRSVLYIFSTPPKISGWSRTATVGAWWTSLR